MNREVVALFLLGLVVLTVGLPVTKTEKKEEGKDAAKTNEEHGIKYDEGYAEDDPRNRPDVSGNGFIKLSGGYSNLPFNLIADAIRVQQIPSGGSECSGE